jgi:hypothetical protein
MSAVKQAVQHILKATTGAMSFPTRKIGNDNVSAVGFGAMGISAWYGTSSHVLAV